MKALITVASKHGATLELGRAMAEVLEERGLAVDLSPPEKVKSLGGYDLIILGSGVYANKMLPTMTALCYRWGDQLSARPVYLFCSGPLDAAPGQTALVPYEARDLARQVGAHSVKLFGGRMELSELRPAERALMRMSGAKAGDYRDWDEVLRWAGEVADHAQAHLHA
ncbi:MAG: flavodoxin domain-containing protein [Bifidobacteriaceae bacterium]|jgi:menaquinone-dependent protoporphyrinogen oxidase|nr:flavodoxin domain-containing protein [Bifidobacteriaceae bacterium]